MTTTPPPMEIYSPPPNSTPPNLELPTDDRPMEDFQSSPLSETPENSSSNALQHHSTTTSSRSASSSHMYSYQETELLYIPCPHCLENIKFIHLNHHISHFHTIKACPMQRFGCDFAATSPKLHNHIHSTCPYYKIKQTLQNLENEIEDQKEARKVLEYDYEALKEEVVQLRRWRDQVERSLTTSSIHGIDEKDEFSSFILNHGGDNREDDHASLLFSSNMFPVGMDARDDPLQQDTARKKSTGKRRKSFQNDATPRSKSLDTSTLGDNSMCLNSLGFDDSNHQSGEILRYDDEESILKPQEKPSFQQFMESSGSGTVSTHGTHFVDDATNSQSENNDNPPSPKPPSSHYQKKETIVIQPRHTQDSPHPLTNNDADAYQFSYLGESLNVPFQQNDLDDDLSSLVRMSQVDEEHLMESTDSVSWDPNKCFPLDQHRVCVTNENSTIKNTDTDPKSKYTFAAVYGDRIFRDWSRIHEYSIIIDELSRSTGIRIGLCDPALPLDTFLGQHQHSWAIDSSGYAGNATRWAPLWSSNLQVDDVITVLLNLKEGSIEFRVNEESMGVVFEEVRGGPLVPCVNLGQGCQVTLI